MNIFFLDKNRVMWCIGATFYGAVIIFLIISLVSYNPTDSSWLYVSTEPGAIFNYGGFLGAQLAAFLLYMFGGASYLLLIPLLTLGWTIFVQKTIKNNWERLCVSFYIVSVGAALLATYYIDCVVSPYPGGLLGLRFAQLLVHYFDPIGRMLFLYGSLCASLIMLFRWSFMFMVQHGMYATVQIYLLMKKYRVINKTAYACGVCAHAIFVRFPIMVTQFIISLLNGTAFYEAELLHPEDNESSDEHHDFTFTHSELIEEFDRAAEQQHQEDIIYVNYLIRSLQKHDIAGVLKADVAPVTLSLPKTFSPKKHIHSKKTDTSILAHKIEKPSFAEASAGRPTSTLAKHTPH